MVKAEVFSSHEEMEKARIAADMLLTPEQRLDVAFQLMELALELSPDRKFPAPEEDGLLWIELKLKDGPLS